MKKSTMQRITFASMAFVYSLSLSAQSNLLEGAIKSTGTPEAAGWAAPGNSSVTWLDARSDGNGSGEYFRTGLKLNNAGDATHSVFYIQNTKTVFTYPVKATPGKMYRVSGQLWKRNGGNATTTYRFSLATDGLNPETAQSKYFAIAGNNKWVDYSIDLGISANVGSGKQIYFVFEVSDPQNWQRGGLFDNINMVELGDACEVSFNTGEANADVESQFFLSGEEYTISKPAEPARNGYTFAGWYADELLTEEFDFTETVSASTTLYAKWESVAPVPTGDNLAAGWLGGGIGTDETPGDNGWLYDGDITWSGVSTGYKNCYRDNLSVNGVTKRILNITYLTGVVAYPVTGMVPGKIYKASASFSHINGTTPVEFGVNSMSDGTGETLGSVSFTAPRWSSTTDESFVFQAGEEDTYYVTWQHSSSNDRSLLWDLEVKCIENAFCVYFIGNDGEVVDKQIYEEASVATSPIAPEVEGLDFAGWYADPEFTTQFDFTQTVSAETKIYARYVDSSVEIPLAGLPVSETAHLQALVAQNAKVSGDASLYLSSKTPLLSRSTIDLEGYSNWLYVEDMRYSKFIKKYGDDRITVNGRKLDIENTDREVVYRNGFVIIPNGRVTKPLTIYNQANCQGESMECEVDTFYRSEKLGETFDNKIRSFVLKKGWSVVFANNPDGTGFSKCFIAQDEDMVVNEMPEGLEFASFIRVSSWAYVSKRGTANLTDGGCSPSWVYNWNINGNSRSTDYEYVGIRQNLGWPSWSSINGKENISTILGYNEPDHTDQSDATPDQAIQQWPEMFKSGRRLGSPAPDALYDTWLQKFIDTIDSLNYRVDFSVAHMYWNGQSGTSLVSAVKKQYDMTNGRTVWITEMNNGANWTTEDWPTNSGPRCDAQGNVIYNEDGTTTTVTRPNSPENAAKQLAWIKDVLPALDNSPYIERHAIYNWVQDARCIVIGGQLTPAGEYFADFNSTLSYNASTAYDHKWKIAPPFVTAGFTDDLASATLSFYDHNGETGKYYVIERQLDEGEWAEYKTLYLGTDYQAGETVSFTDSLEATSKQTYRIKAMSYKDTESIYSRIVGVTRDVTGTPVLNANVLAATAVKLSWDAVSGARAYTLERAASENGEYTVLLEKSTDLEYVDENLTPATTYYYRLTVNSTAATAPVSTSTVTTNVMTAPARVENLRAASGDNRIVLTWDFAYDADWKVCRDGIEIGSVAAMATPKYEDVAVANGNEYTYTVVAANAAGVSEESESVAAFPFVGQWARFKFDENSGTTAYDDWGGYHAALSEGVNWVQAQDEESMAAQTVRSNSSYIQLGENITKGLKDFTIFMRMRFDGTYARVFDFGSNTANFMMVSASSSTLRYKITNSDGDVNDYTFKNLSLPKDTWTTIAFTYQTIAGDSTTGATMKVYINGSEAGSADFENAVYPDDLGDAPTNYLGRSHWSSDAYADHAYECLQMFNTALTAEQIARLEYKTVVLYDSKENTLEENADTVNIELIRSFAADSWNTVCLPFNLSAEQIEEAFGADAELKEFSNYSADENRIKFEDATAITAGKPYLVRMKQNVTNPRFCNVISASEPAIAESNGVSFVGTFSPVVLSSTDAVFSDNNKLEQTAEGSALNGFRCYLQFPDEETLSTVRVVLDDSEPTAIVTPAVSGSDGGLIYSIGGVVMGKSKNSLSDGIYIVNGKKQLKK